jgi:hypothetical protein
MIVDGLSWVQFTSLPYISILPLSRQLIEYEIYNQGLIQEAIHIQQMYNQEQVVPSVSGGGIDVLTIQQLSSNCIQFVVDTTEGGTTFVVVVESSSSTTSNVDWGDGTIEEVELQNGSTQVGHTYSEENTTYEVNMCFADTSLITNLAFPGN